MGRFIGGDLQAEFMYRLRGVDPSRCLVVPVDVGKSMAMSLVADHYGEIVTPSFEFDLTETGVAELIAAVSSAERSRSAVETAAMSSATPVSVRSNSNDGVTISP